MDLTTLLQDERLGLEMPPDALERVDRRARLLRRRRRALFAVPLVLVAAVSLWRLPLGVDQASLDYTDGTPTATPIATNDEVRDDIDALILKGHRVDYAVELLVQDCMQRLGFDYKPNPYGPVRLGLPQRLEPEVAAQRGYGIHDMMASSGGGASPEYLRLSSSDRARYSEAYSGAGPSASSSIPELAGIGYGTTGCLGGSRLELWGSKDAIAVDQFLVNSGLTMLGILPPPSSTDWAACMTGAGYPDVADPSAAQQKAAASDRSGEIAMATADARCQESTGYADALDELIEQRLETYVDAHGGFMDYLHRTTAAAALRAEAVIDAHGG